MLRTASLAARIPCAALAAQGRTARALRGLASRSAGRSAGARSLGYLNTNPSLQALHAARPRGSARGHSTVVCAAAVTAVEGDIVKVHFKGSADGAVFEDSREAGEPYEFTVGQAKLRGFDEAVQGLAVGETKEMVFPPELGFGEKRSDLVITLPKNMAPEGLAMGSAVRISTGGTAIVTAVDGDNFTIDANHVLAGKETSFELELLELTAGASLETATFGMGCFWGPELRFQRVPGIVTTATGYCNGKSASVTYEEVCSGTTGASEVVQVRFDPAKVSFNNLLDVFWAGHDPTQVNAQGNDTGTQYRSGVYTHTPEQAAAARESAAQYQLENPGMPLATEIIPIANYCQAEDYHQQYLAKGGRSGSSQSPAKGCNDPIRCYG